MEYKFQHYFPELKEEEAIFARNPFSNSLDVSDIADEMQEQFIELKNDSTARDTTTKSHYRSFDVIYLNHIHKYRNWHFEHCCPSLQYTCVRADFRLVYISKLRKETE